LDGFARLSQRRESVAKFVGKRPLLKVKTRKLGFETVSRFMPTLITG